MAASDKSAIVSSTTDFSSDSTVSDDWQELTKSDYAKVIFSDLLCNAASGTVECKFQITDNVHEDPNDYVGLFCIGHENLSQCLVSKMLSQTKCEDDGKLQRCVFASTELPRLDDGFYQFLYVTRDQEVCGASMPFQIKMSPIQVKESSVDSSVSENMDGGFLLVSNEIEGKGGKVSSDHKKAPAERSSLSERKKEEIAAWISQNPDYYSLIEQNKEHTYTIDALQQSKDLATKEVAQLYDILNTQNGELIQLKNMLAAYEEKVKMSRCLQDEKNNELIQTRKMFASYKEKTCIDLGLQEERNVAITKMRKSLTAYEEKIKLYELLQNEKDEELSGMKNEFLLQEKKLKTSLAFQDQQQTEINDLKKELEEMKQKQKAKECHQVTAEIGHSMETLILKTQDLVRIISATIKNLDFTDEDEVEKFFQLKIQLLIILSKMARATDLANICERNGLHKTIHSIIEDDVIGNSYVGPTSCALEDRDPVFAITTNTGSSKEEIPCFPTSSTAEAPPLPNSREKEVANEDVSKKVAQRISFNKAFESAVLEHQIIELPRLDVINEITAKTLLADRPLDAEDVTVINKLTENIIKRGFNLYEGIEVVDDSFSDSGSDASEISECSSFLKRDLLCVGRIMETLSCISNQTILEQLVVIEKEEDKNLIHKNEWNGLLQKCALRYQIEILLEHIEKQKEGMKKVSEKICDLLTKCMVLKDELSDSNAVCEKLQKVIDKKDLLIPRLKKEVEMSYSVFSHFSSQKDELEYRAELAKRTIEDLHARLMEASDLYKQQYTEIQRLSKKLRKYKAEKDKTKFSKGESSLFSSESSKTTSSFEVAKEDSVQNINDSDTGEHMFEEASLISNENNKDSKTSTMDRATIQSIVDLLNYKAQEPIVNACTATHSMKHKKIQAQVSSNAELTTLTESYNPLVSSFKVPDLETFCSYTAPEACSATHKGIQTQIDSNKELKTLTENCPGLCLSSFDDLLPLSSICEFKSGNSTVQTTAGKTNTETVECKSYQTGSLFSNFASYEHFQEVIKEIFANIKNPAASRTLQEYSISCYICKKVFSLGPEAPMDLINHLESEHSMKMCPVCGQLFEDAVPPKYFQIHVEQHFETE